MCVIWITKKGYLYSSSVFVDKKKERGDKSSLDMPPTISTNSDMCSLCPRSKKTHPSKKLVRFDSVVDTFSISDSTITCRRRVRYFTSFFLNIKYTILKKTTAMMEKFFLCFKLIMV